MYCLIKRTFLHPKNAPSHVVDFWKGTFFMEKNSFCFAILILYWPVLLWFIPVSKVEKKMHGSIFAPERNLDDWHYQDAQGPLQPSSFRFSPAVSGTVYKMFRIKRSLFKGYPISEVFHFFQCDPLYAGRLCDCLCMSPVIISISPLRCDSDTLQRDVQIVQYSNSYYREDIQ